MKKYTFILGVIGMLFAGYMSFFKVLSDTCVFDQPCPYFLGYPACYYGFALFTLVVLVYVLDSWKMVQERTAEFSLMAFSLIGILFSGYFALQELPRLLSDGITAYYFGLPTCIIGLFFYVMIFLIASYTALKNSNESMINGPGE